MIAIVIFFVLIILFSILFAIGLNKRDEEIRQSAWNEMTIKQAEGRCKRDNTQVQNIDDLFKEQK